MPLPIITGEFRAGGDAELKFTPGGQAVASFSVIASRNKKKDDGTWETTAETGWLRVNVWGMPFAERIANEVVKGSRVHLTGEYQQRTYTSREGVEKISCEIIARSVEVIPDRDQPQRQPSTGGSSAGDPWGAPAAQTDDPPFFAPIEHNPFI